MNDIKAVIDCCVDMLNTELTFAPFSFTIAQFFIASAVLSLCIGFIVHIFR